MADQSQTTKLPCREHCADPLWCIQRDGLCKSGVAREAARPRVHLPQITPEQAAADIFDCDLFRLLTRAEGYCERRSFAADRWAGIARELRAARARVRGLMHAEDLAATQG